MVKIIQKENKSLQKSSLLYQCEACGFLYEEKQWAEKCEAWCKEHNSCNIEITAHAVHDVEDTERSVL